MRVLAAWSMPVVPPSTEVLSRPTIFGIVVADLDSLDSIVSKNVDGIVPIIAIGESVDILQIMTWKIIQSITNKEVTRGYI